MFNQRTPITHLKAWFLDHITNALRSVVFAAGRGVDPEFLRAIVSVAEYFGITQDELRRGCTRVQEGPWMHEGLIVALKSTAKAAGRNVHPEFTRGLSCVAASFGIEESELQ